MKRTYLAMITVFVLVLTLGFTALSAGEDVKVYLDGTELTFDTPPQIVGGRTMVPMRAIFEAIGAEIKWDDAAKSVTAISDSTVIALVIGSSTAYINGDAVTLDQAAFINNGRTYVPLRFIGEGTGASVEWDEAARTVIITTAITDGQ